MTEQKINEIQKKYKKEFVANTVGFIVFGLLVLGIMLGCKTCSETADTDSARKPLNMNVCPAGGSDGDAESDAQDKPELPAGHPDMTPKKPQSMDNIPHIKGKVVETMNSGRYTYVLVEGDGKKTWAAAPEFKVKVGDQAVFPLGMPMKNFKSRTLDRTFEIIYFSGDILIVPAR